MNEEENTNLENNEEVTFQSPVMIVHRNGGWESENIPNAEEASF